MTQDTPNKSIDDYTAPRITKALYQLKAGEREANLNKGAEELLREIAITGFENFYQLRDSITTHELSKAWEEGFREFGNDRYIAFLRTYLQEHAREYLGDEPANLKELRDHIATIPALNGLEYTEGFAQAYKESRNSTLGFTNSLDAVCAGIRDGWTGQQRESESEFRVRMNRTLAYLGIEPELK